jgi:hypothetical protein
LRTIFENTAEANPIQDAMNNYLNALCGQPPR